MRGVLLVLLWLSITATALGQSQSPEAAAVVIDGGAVLQLKPVGEVSAAARADFTNRALQELVLQAGRPSPASPSSNIRVRLQENDGLVTLRASRRHLLTVTEQDLIPGISAREQAEIWARRLQQALDRARTERQPSYRQRALKTGLAMIAIAAVLGAVLHRSRRWLWRRQTRTGKLPTGLLPALVCGQILLWVTTFVWIWELFPETRGLRYQLLAFLRNVFTSPLLDIDGQGYSLTDVLRLILLTLALWVGVRIVTSAIKSRLLQAAIPNRGLQDGITTLIQVMLTGLGLFIILQALGIDLSALAILASVLGVGLGFGLQNIANNFVSGWIMLFEGSIQVGDFINLGELVGTVEHIGARSTEIRTPDRVSIIVPNAELLENKVINWSHGHPVSQLHLALGVAYHSDIRRVHTAVMEVARAHPCVLQYPAPRLRFLGFGDSALNFDMLVWIRDPRQQFDLKSDLYYMLATHLGRYGIELPFPQRDLHLRSPQLEQVMAAWNQSEQPPTPPTPTAALAHFNLLEDVQDYSSLLQGRDQLQEAALSRLVEQMRSENGVAIQDRRFRFNVYPRCFIGSEAVTWLANTQNATREAAVRIGQTLVEKGIIHHVTDEHPFRDEYLFYRFYEDE